MNVLVISKPAGLLSQGGSLDGEDGSDAPNLVDWARGYFGRHYVGLVHRLDRNTSGLMVLAKRSKAAERLTLALQKGTLERVYWAWLRGRLEHETEWRHWLLKDERTNITRVLRGTPTEGAKAPQAGAKWAALRVKPLEYGRLGNSDLTLAEFRLETGRSHQIRAQASEEGHPLVGDAKYGGGSDFARTALHSARLSFPHPISKEILIFEDSLPADMARLRR